MARYKFSLAPKVRGYVEWQLEHYHEDKKQLDAYRAEMLPSITASYSHTGGTSGGTVSNPTETCALRMASSPYIFTTERSIRAIEHVINACDETDKRLIDLVYWERTYTIVNAAPIVGLTKSPAYERINDILCRIALEIGLIGL